jgi:hypothetical protein
LFLGLELATFCSAEEVRKNPPAGVSLQTHPERDLAGLGGVGDFPAVILLSLPEE